MVWGGGSSLRGGAGEGFWEGRAARMWEQLSGPGDQKQRVMLYRYGGMEVWRFVLERVTLLKDVLFSERSQPGAGGGREGKELAVERCWDGICDVKNLSPLYRVLSGRTFDNRNLNLEIIL